MWRAAQVPGSYTVIRGVCTVHIEDHGDPLILEHVRETLHVRRRLERYIFSGASPADAASPALARTL